MSRRDSAKLVFNPDNPLVNTSDTDLTPLLATPNDITQQGIVRMFLTTFTAALGPVCFGYAMGYASPATTDLQEGNGGQRNVLSDELISWFGVSAIFTSLIM